MTSTVMVQLKLTMALFRKYVKESKMDELNERLL